MAYMCMRICWRKSARGNSEMRQPTSFPQKMAHYFEWVSQVLFSVRDFSLTVNIYSSLNSMKKER